MKGRTAAATALDLFGVACIAAFAWFIWAPAVLLPLAAAALFASWSMNRGDGS